MGLITSGFVGVDGNDMIKRPAVSDEPRIQIGGRVLSHAQASAVRNACAHFCSQIEEDAEFRALLGPIAEAYLARLNEVLQIMTP